MRELRLIALAQGLWGSEFAGIHTLPNLLDEMDACGCRTRTEAGMRSQGQASPMQKPDVPAAGICFSAFR
jgi:hypothetical protein